MYAHRMMNYVTRGLILLGCAALLLFAAFIIAAQVTRVLRLL